jgi:hypothetical protein
VKEPVALGTAIWTDLRAVQLCVSKSNKLVGEPFSFFDRAVALRKIEQLGQSLELDSVS